MSGISNHSYRPDAFVDGIDWKDTGCHVAPRCLECPLVECVFERVGDRDLWSNTQRKNIRAKFIKKAISLGYKKADIAKEFGISLRTVYRA